MSNLTNDQLLDLIEETLAWGSDVSERWSGTLHEKIIETQRARIKEAVNKNDLELAYSLVRDLAQTLEVSEKELQKVEG